MPSPLPQVLRPEDLTEECHPKWYIHVTCVHADIHIDREVICMILRTRFVSVTDKTRTLIAHHDQEK